MAGAPASDGSVAGSSVQAARPASAMRPPTATHSTTACEPLGERGNGTAPRSPRRPERSNDGEVLLTREKQTPEKLREANRKQPNAERFSGQSPGSPGLAPPTSSGLTCKTVPTSEPFATALLLAIAGLLLGSSVLLSRASNRIGVPIVLLFLCIGMLAGSEGVGGIPFEDYGLAFRLGTVALVLILFDGGLNTPMAALRRRWAPARCSRRSGVALTAGLIALPAHGGGSRGRWRWCSARWCRRPTRRRCSRCSAAAACSSSGGWARRSSSSRASTIRWRSSSRSRSRRTCSRRARSRRRGSCSRWRASSLIGGALGVGVGLRRALAARRIPLPARRALPGAHARARVPRVRRADAASRQRLPGGVRRRLMLGNGPLPDHTACSGCTTRSPGWVRS